MSPELAVFVNWVFWDEDVGEWRQPTDEEEQATHILAFIGRRDNTGEAFELQPFVWEGKPAAERFALSWCERLASLLGCEVIEVREP